MRTSSHPFHTVCFPIRNPLDVTHDARMNWIKMLGVRHAHIITTPVQSSAECSAALSVTLSVNMCLCVRQQYNWPGPSSIHALHPKCKCHRTSSSIHTRMYRSNDKKAVAAVAAHRLKASHTYCSVGNISTIPQPPHTVLIFLKSFSQNGKWLPPPNTLAHRNVHNCTDMHIYE